MTLASILSLSASSTGRAATLARRLRAAQHPPPEVGQPATSLGCLDGFLDRLVDLPLAEWLAIGESVVADRDRLPVRQRAWDELEAKLLSDRFGLAVWRVRDAVDTAAHIASRELHDWSRAERGMFAAAHGAAEAAALALLARDVLSTETYHALTAPFASCLVVAGST